jgi:hypothetical protein
VTERLEQDAQQRARVFVVLDDENAQAASRRRNAVSDRLVRHA